MKILCPFFVFCISVNDIGGELFEKLVCVFAVCLNRDGLEQIKAENTHDRLCINNIASRNEINFAVKSNNDIYKITDLCDRGYTNLLLFHFNLRSSAKCG